MKRVYDSEFFNIKDTLECGQIFRFRPFKKGYMVFSGENACYAYAENGKTVVEAEDIEYFDKFFDSETDYKKICLKAENCGFDVVKKSARLGKGIRILRQNPEETLYSFIISQNNNIPRIKGIIEKTCAALGEKREFSGEEYYTFPKTEMLLSKDESFYKGLGYGYRAGYITAVAKAIAEGFDLESISDLPTKQLKEKLLTLKGVGPKVADCVTLFGYHKTDSFPVDTWIEKLYVEDFNGREKDRNRITEYFLNIFGENSGYVQQYIFYYKRSLETQDK
ncbi:MAG: hypothetical protein J5836_02885 [Clostridia bacterium]|nr:hypothetical protein [Clostridia bacterium]